MADELIQTYTDLRDEIAAYLSRENKQSFTDRAPLFIQLCEAEINRRIDVSDQEITATLSFAIGDKSKDLPTDYGGLRGLPYMPNNSLRPLEFAVPSQFRTRYRDPALRDVPRIYTIQENKLFIKPVPDSAVDIEILYYQGVPALRSAGGGTNWLLDSHPDLYLKGSIYQAHLYTGASQKAAEWKILFEEAMDTLDLDDWNSRWAGSPLLSTPNKRESGRGYPRFRYQGAG